MKKLQRILGVFLALTLLCCQIPVCYAAIHEHDWHYTWDEGLHATCDMCNAAASVTVNTETAFSYCPDSPVLSEQWVTADEWPCCTDVGSAADAPAAYFFVYAEQDSNQWLPGVPSQPGNYKVSVSLDADVEVEDVSGDYGVFETYATVHIGHRAADTWSTSGKSLCLTCNDCQQPVAKITLSDAAEKGCCRGNTVTPNVTTWFADDETESTVTLPDYAVLYKGKGSTKYTLSKQQPMARGTYTIYLALLANGSDPSSATVKTETCSFTVNAHSWTYWSNEYSLYAQCELCGESAEVTIDTSTVYEASRTYDGSKLDYEVFYEKNWSNQKDIEAYNVLFSGTQTVSETSTTVYDHAYLKPNSTGNYNVRIALLKDPDNPDTTWLQTKEKVYYLADISLNECIVLSYGNTQIAQFTEPKLVDGYYQVGTLSELLWCMSKHNSDANISLTNDIVVNPITVNENGEIRSAGYQVYKWIGFGTENKPYTGNICGNGYTVYGIYQPNTSVHFNGFVNNGKNCQISDLTVENSVIYGTDSAAIAGHYDHTSSKDDKVTNCHGLNCYINGAGTCGGIISWLTTEKNGSAIVYGCTSDSILCGAAERGAGGIVGRAKGVDAVYIQHCGNLGPVSSDKGMAGGIIGYADMDSADSYLAIWDCFNIGSVTCPKYVGGIAGYLKDYNGNEGYFFDNCTSTGYLSAGSSVGGIAGYISTKGIWDRREPSQGNYYYNAKVAFKTADAKVDLEGHAAKMTKDQVNGNFICSRYEHTPNSHWTAVSAASCTKDGELLLNCAVCGATLERETVRAYGHHFEYGECVYCGADEDDIEQLEGSVFGNTPLMITVAAVGALVILMAAWLLIKRKQRKKVTA